jgi:hypothetical protein
VEEKPSYSDFVAAAMEFLSSRPDSSVLILVEGAKGFETFRNHPGFAWSFGALEMAKSFIMASMAATNSPDTVKKINDEEAQKIEAFLSGRREKPN